MQPEHEHWEGMLGHRLVVGPEPRQGRIAEVRVPVIDAGFKISISRNEGVLLEVRIYNILEPMDAE